MDPEQPLIPPPDVVREQLVRCDRERKLLLSLYRLSCKAEMERREHERNFGRHQPRGQAVPV